MVNVTKQFLSGASAPLLSHPIPKMCEDARTIVLNQYSLLLFPDKSNLNLEYIEKVLPTLLTNNFTKEQHVEWFKKLPAGSYLEFDRTKKFLYLCSITP
jgi:hypothetical protein